MVRKARKKGQAKQNEQKEDVAAIVTAGNNNNAQQQKQQPTQQVQNQEQQNLQQIQQQPRPHRQNNVQGGFQQQANMQFYPRMPGVPQFTTNPPQQYFNPYFTNQNQWQNNYRPRQQAAGAPTTSSLQ